MNQKNFKVALVLAFLIPTALSVKALVDIDSVSNLVDFVDWAKQEKDEQLQSSVDELTSEVEQLTDEVTYLREQLESTQYNLSMLERRLSSMEFKNSMMIK